MSLSEPGPRLERVIGVGGPGCSAVNCIVGSGIFGLPGLPPRSGPAAFLAYLVCVVLIGLVGLCFAEAGSFAAQRVYAVITCASRCPPSPPHVDPADRRPACR